MRCSFTLFAAILILAAPKPTIASDAETAKEYMHFLRPFAGTWRRVEQAGDAERVATTWRAEIAPSRLYGSSTTEAGGRQVSQGLHAYDPEQDCWKVVIVSSGGEARPFASSTNYLRFDAPVAGVVRAGVTATSELKVVGFDGSVQTRKGRMTFWTVAADLIEYEIGAVTVDGEGRPNLRVTLKRIGVLEPANRGDQE